MSPCLAISVAKIQVVMILRASRKSASERVERMLVSVLRRMVKRTAAWWFSRGEMSLYTMARSVKALTWYALLKPG